MLHDGSVTCGRMQYLLPSCELHLSVASEICYLQPQGGDTDIKNTYIPIRRIRSGSISVHHKISTASAKAS